MADPRHREAEIEQQRRARRIRAENEKRRRTMATLSDDGRPAVLLVADVKTWAWAKKAAQVMKHLSPHFRMNVWYQKLDPPPDFGPYDVVHSFEFPQIDHLKDAPREKVVTGITAHVWKTWGEERVRAWADRAVAVHANSVLLVEEMAHVLDQRVYYTPNGVCPQTYRRILEREGPPVVGHVGKPHPRKGSDILREACDAANVQLRALQRKSGNALSEQEMVDWYQDVDVLLFASDMDGTPNPALEGAACECVIVSTPIGNMPEFIEDGMNGFLVGREPGGFARVLRLFKQSPELARAMGREARRTVLAGWTWKRQVAYYRRLWNDVVAGTTGSVSSVAYAENGK